MPGNSSNPVGSAYSSSVTEKDVYIIVKKNYSRVIKGDTTKETEGLNSRTHVGDATRTTTGDVDIRNRGNLSHTHDGDISESLDGNLGITHKGTTNQEFRGVARRMFASTMFSLRSIIDLSVFIGARARASAVLDAIADVGVRLKLMVSEEGFILRRNRLIVNKNESIMYNNKFGFFQNKTVGAKKNIVVTNLQLSNLDKELNAVEKNIIAMSDRLAIHSEIKSILNKEETETKEEENTVSTSNVGMNMISKTTVTFK